MKTCCPILPDVVGRVQPSDRIGLMVERSLFEKKDNLVVRMRKARKADRPETWECTFAIVRFCPFCGTKVEES